MNQEAYDFSSCSCIFSTRKSATVIKKLMVLVSFQEINYFSCSPCIFVTKRFGFLDLARIVYYA